jgi:hypothetical protein
MHATAAVFDVDAYELYAKAGEVALEGECVAGGKRVVRVTGFTGLVGFGVMAWPSQAALAIW